MTQGTEPPPLATDVKLDAGWRDGFLASGCVLSAAPGTVWAGWGGAERSDRPVDGRLSVFTPDFFLRDDRPWLVYESAALIPGERLANLLAGVPTDAPLEWRAADREGFAVAFGDIQNRIAEGSLEKAVPVVARRADPPFGTGHRASVLARALELSHRFPIAAYGFWTADGRGMIGETPELLFEQVSPQRLRTMALAGTRPRDESGASLLDDPKNRFEHQVVIDGIVALLSPYGTVEVGTTEEIFVPGLAHLRTPIDVVPSGPVAFETWARVLHPTPALGAWPREAGSEWLRSQPNAESRGRFGAPFGMVPPEGGCGKCVVAIRNVRWNPERVAIAAGCGVVRQSRLDREWQELNAKLDSVQEALGL